MAVRKRVLVYILAAAGAAALAAAIAACGLTDNFLWQSISARAITVTLDPDGGEGGTETVQASLHKPLPDITVPVKPLCAFAGYWTGKDGTGTQYYTADGTTARPWDIANDYTLYALWEDEEGTVTTVYGFVIADTKWGVYFVDALGEWAGNSDEPENDFVSNTPEEIFHFLYDKERLLNYADWNKAAQWSYGYHVVDPLEYDETAGGQYLAVRRFRDTGLDIRDVTNDDDE
jgi:hypothetical protein